MPNKIGVPMPATRLYKEGMNEPETIRDRFIAQYGEDTVRQAELQTVLDMLMLMGVVKPAEFVEVMTNKLKRVDDMRRRQVGMDT